MSLTTSEMSPADIAAVTNGGGGFGDNGLWWLAILFLFGRGGFGGGYGGGDGAPATQADVQRAVDQQTLISKLDNQTYGLADSTYALNNTIVNGFHGVDHAVCDLGYKIQDGVNTISRQIGDCCCTTQRAIDGINYNMAKGFSDLGNTVANNIRDVIDNQNANARAIMDFMVQDKISALQNENNELRLSASQAKQNQYLIDQLKPPVPIPAYPACNPYAPVFGACGNS